MNFNIIGTGRLGTALIETLTGYSDWTLNTVFNRTVTTAQTVVARVGAGTAVSQLAQLHTAALTFITTPDDAIECVAQAIPPAITVGGNKPVVVHCSGLLSSTLLAGLRTKGYQVASMHPLKAFVPQADAPNALMNCPCVLEGDEGALALLMPLLNQLGAKPFVIAAEGKAKYHAAAVMASNYLVTLAHFASGLMQDVGFDEAQANGLVLQLMQSNLNNLANVPQLAQGLTGPIARGDVRTLQQHLTALGNTEVADLYRNNGQATVSLTTLDKARRLALIEVLSV